MKNTFTVGRNNTADIIVKDKTVSGMHLTMTVMGEKIQINDENSTNGIFVLQNVGRKKITQQIIDFETPISLGEYKTTPRKLLNLYQSKPVSDEAQAGLLVSQTATKNSNAKDFPFSRYITNADGTKGKI